MHSGLIQHTQRNPDAPQELVAELQVAGVVQVHPEHMAHCHISGGGWGVGPPVRRRRDWTPVSPHGQLVNVLFLHVKLPLRVTEGSRHLRMKRRQVLKCYLLFTQKNMH